MDFAKVGVEGSNPFARSRINKKIIDMRTAIGAVSAYMRRKDPLQTLLRLGSRVRILWLRSSYARDKMHLRGAFSCGARCDSRCDCCGRKPHIIPTAGPPATCHAQVAQRPGGLGKLTSLACGICPSRTPARTNWLARCHVDVFFDTGEVARRFVPSAVLWLHDHGLSAGVLLLVKAKAALDPDFGWALDNGKWVMGTNDAIETLRAFDPYTLKDVAPRTRGDVLILAGANDHFVPASQVQAFERSLSGARSVTTRVYDEALGGAEHCQLGAATLWHSDFFDWVTAKFGDLVTRREGVHEIAE
jgi:hypothetical protein